MILGGAFVALISCGAVASLGELLLPRFTAITLESVQQSRLDLDLRFDILKIEMQIGAQIRKIVIHYLKLIFNTSKLNIEMQIEI